VGHDDKDDQRGVALRNVEQARENVAVADLAPLRDGVHAGCGRSTTS
jgi:hypothetical protein